MIRAKITSYLPQDLADTLRRVAAVRDRSVSDIIEEAIAKAFSTANRDAEQAALMARLEMITRKLGVIEKGQETHFELSAHTARFVMSVTPEVSEPEKPAFNARGAERFRNVVDAIIQRLAKGRSVWRDNFGGDVQPASTAQSVRAAE